jgi:hypothetical protein
LVIEDKSDRVYNFQRKTIESCLHLIASAGLEHPSQLNSNYVLTRTNNREAVSYAKLKPPLQPGELLTPSMREHELRRVWSIASENLSKPKHSRIYS